MFNAVVNFGDIKGEVTEKGHKDWVAATKVTFNVSKPAEGAKPGTLTIEKPLDKSSPKLIEAVAKGTHIPEVTIDYTKPTSGTGVKYLEIKLKEVVVSNITHQADPAHGDVTPFEQITLTYRTMQQTYTEQGADGKADGNVVGTIGIASAARA